MYQKYTATYILRQYGFPQIHIDKIHEHAKEIYKLMSLQGELIYWDGYLCMKINAVPRPIPLPAEKKEAYAQKVPESIVNQNLHAPYTVHSHEYGTQMPASKPIDKAYNLQNHDDGKCIIAMESENRSKCNSQVSQEISRIDVIRPAVPAKYYQVKNEQKCEQYMNVYPSANKIPTPPKTPQKFYPIDLRALKANLTANSKQHADRMEILHKNILETIADNMKVQMNTYEYKEAKNDFILHATSMCAHRLSNSNLALSMKIAPLLLENFEAFIYELVQAHPLHSAYVDETSNIYRRILNGERYLEKAEETIDISKIEGRVRNYAFEKVNECMYNVGKKMPNGMNQYHYY